MRYWSLCIVLKGRHTGDCLRDEQVEIPSGTENFTAIVSPTCPVVGYANCILSGPQELQSSISYRNLLPSPSFKPDSLQRPLPDDCHLRRSSWVTEYSRPPITSGPGRTLYGKPAIISMTSSRR